MQGCVFAACVFSWFCAGPRLFYSHAPPGVTHCLSIPVSLVFGILCPHARVPHAVADWVRDGVFGGTGPHSHTLGCVLGGILPPLVAAGATMSR